MVLKRGGFLFNIAYGLDKRKPCSDNLCRFLGKLIAMLLFVWPTYLMLRAFLFVMFVIITIIGLLFTMRLPINENEEKIADGLLMVQFKRWPTIRGHRVWPISLLALIVGWWSLIKLILFAPMVLLVMIVVIISSSEIRRVVKGYLEARKEKICPMVNFK